VFASLAVALAGTAHAGSPVATIQDPQGEVFIQRKGSAPNAWEPAVSNAAVNNGDSVKTKNGSLKLVYGDQATVSVQPETTLVLKQESNSQDLHLKIGKLKIEANKDKISKPFQVVTPVAVGAVRGTSVVFGFDGANLFAIDLDTGEVFIYNNEAGLELLLSGDKSITIWFDPDTGTLTITNNSNEPIDYYLGGEKYTIGPGETHTARIKTQSSIDDTGAPDPKSETVPNEKAEIPESSSP
jgi:hypothetical protein